jgi:hypothetical protein
MSCWDVGPVGGVRNRVVKHLTLCYTADMVCRWVLIRVLYVYAVGSCWKGDSVLGLYKIGVDDTLQIW